MRALLTLVAGVAVVAASIAGSATGADPYKRHVIGATQIVQTLRYAFQRPGRSVVVTYTTLPSLKTRYAQRFARSAASIRFGS